jgi:hypothetical protein
MIFFELNNRMDIREVRRANLMRLIGSPNEHGAAAQFATRHNLNPDQIRHILTRHRQMGEKLARKLELSIGLPALALDNPLDSRVMEESATYTAQQIGPDAMLLLESFRAATPEIRAAALRMLGVPAGQDTEKPNK